MPPATAGSGAGVTGIGVLVVLLVSSALAAAPPSAVTSNIQRGDYAGSAACATCHKDVTAKWDASPMHRMTRNIASAAVRAPFNGGTFAFKSDRVRFDRVGADRFVSLESTGNAHVYRVTRVIGGRYREDFAGVEVARAEAGAPIIGDASKEVILPASFVFSGQSFRHKGYSVMNTQRPGLRAGPVWNEACIDCHNTAPYLSVILGALYGRGAPGFQGEVVDRLLPADRRWSFEVTDASALQRAVRKEIELLGAAPPVDGGTAELLEQAIEVTRDRFSGGHLVEVGIGCESCHGGSKEHVSNPSLAPSYEPKSPFVHAAPPAGVTPSRALLINRTCARCHQVLFSRYPYTWEGGQRTQGAGGSTINSGEGRDFLLSRCSNALACTACHDPHAEDSRAALEALATPAGNKACTGCHAAYRTGEALRAHAHHDPKGAGGSCVACHMPRKNMGLGYALTRYHRIGSPDEPRRVERDRPLECALCHADKGAEALVSDMEAWWGKRYDRQALRTLYGDLRAPVLLQTLARGKPHEQAVAMSVLGTAGDRAAVPQLAAGLTHPYPLVRYYAKRALEQLTSTSVPVDLDANDATIRSQTESWRSKTKLSDR